jgi:hypothetical protein
MEHLIGQIDWSEVGGFIMAVAVVFILFERAWKLFERVTHKGKKGDDDDEKGPMSRCVPADVDVRRMAHQIDELHEMHEVFDQDGVRVWYVRRSFYEMMEKSSEALQKISALLPAMLDNQRKMDDRLEEIQHNTQRKEQ